MTDKANLREIVLDMLLPVIEGDKFSHTELSHTLKRYQNLEKQERSFISRLFTGTIKRYLTLDYIINQFSSIPAKKMKPLIRNILRLSVYQLLFMDQVPESAICNEAVKLAKKRGFEKLSGFVNGNLRNMARNRDAIVYPDRDKDPAGYLEISYSAPEWLVKQFIGQYGFETAEMILSASLKEKELTIRCNQKKISPQDLEKLLVSEGVTVEKSGYLDYAFRIKDFDYLEKLDAFCNGYFAVQDVSSMLVCEAAGITENDFVVDVCAAPGGKTLHAAERAKLVSARDLTDYKIRLVEENRKRLGASNVETRVWDAMKTDASLINKADVVIADLPCSGLGVLGKKPDLKYKLTQNQQKELIQLQRNILDVIKAYVKPGGILIYSTCTINREENTGNRSWFLKHSDYEAESLDTYLPEALHNDTTKDGYLQLLQGVHPADGFFISRFRRKLN